MSPPSERAAEAWWLSAEMPMTARPDFLLGRTGTMGMDFGWEAAAAGGRSQAWGARRVVRHAPGDKPVPFLKARLNAASES